VTRLPPGALRRTGAVLATGSAAYAVASLLDLEPDLPAVLLLTALVATGTRLLVEGVGLATPVWYPPVAPDPLTRGRDGATFADLRLLESHRSARHPDQHLQRRLRDLADRALVAAHGVDASCDEGRALLGARVVALLEVDRRLSVREIELCLRTIEELT
jgi:hypothetical protein